MNTNKFLTLFLSSLLLLCSNYSHACSEFETGESTRLGSFYVHPFGMESYIPFTYTYNLYYSSNSDPFQTDKKQLLSEWEKELGEKVKPKDIEVILYQASPNMFLLSNFYHKLQFTFEGNTFIDFILLPENKEYLDYMVILKQMEYLEFCLSDEWSGFYYWESKYNENKTNNLFKSFCIQYIDFCKSQIAGNKHDFLKARYHYQLAKIYLKNEMYTECDSVLTQYFDTYPDSKSILNNGMFHYKGVCLMNKKDIAGANLYFARSFSGGNERKFRNMQLFSTTEKDIRKTLKLTSNNSERALILSMQALRNPGRALTQLKTIAQINSNCPEFLFLIYREVNKFDDWITSPIYANQSPTVTSVDYWSGNYAKILKENIKKDQAYLKEFIAWLAVVKGKFSGQPRLYIELANIHLCLINNDATTATNLYNQLKIDKSNPYYNLYNTEGMYLNIMSPNFDSDASLNTLTNEMKPFIESGKTNLLESKMLYTLTRILSFKMNKIGKKYYAGLIFMKSDYFASFSNYYFTEYSLYNYDYDNTFFNNYQYIRWFDQNATISDVDTLINLSLNKHKKPYQTFFTDSVMGSTDVYRDLKGTMAFRNGNLILANKTFQEMNPHYWDSEELQEDPFVPKYWPAKRKFNNKFTKLGFTNEMVRLTNQTKSLDKETSAQAWLKLGHGYYNTTNYGNNWLMNLYYLSNYYDIKISILPNSFYTCSIAKECYINAVKQSKNKELIATAVFMIYACEYNSASYNYYNNPKKRSKNSIFRSLWLKDFAIKYKDTKVFQEYLSNCSYLNEYMKKGYLVIGNN